MKLSEKIHNQLIKYGCSDIKTPTLEFFNVYDSQNNAFDCRNMYKFFDKDGEILVLRPDYTPAIARCVAKYYKDETLPLRFCYEGNTFINQSDYQGRLKETIIILKSIKEHENSLIGKARKLHAIDRQIYDDGIKLIVDEFSFLFGMKKADFYTELTRILDKSLEQ